MEYIASESRYDRMLYRRCGRSGLKLSFTEGENGEMTIWNWIGLAYAVLVVVVLKYLYKNGNGN